jgi:phosphoribosylanthranilate isomerase
MNEPMNLWIKICGNTSLADALLAAASGADAVGFIFAPSPRRVTPGQVALITPHLSKTIEKIGVFVDANFAEIASTVEQSGLTGAQLHSESPAELAAQLRHRFGEAFRILQVIHYGTDALAQLSIANAASAIDAVLVDSRTATAVGGTGIAFDWVAARQSIFTPERQLKLVAAGGLNPANVAQAIATLHPWGVDAVSGVEASPGIKDPGKVQAFVETARSAAVASETA